MNMNIKVDIYSRYSHKNTNEIKARTELIEKENQYFQTRQYRILEQSGSGSNKYIIVAAKKDLIDKFDSSMLDKLNNFKLIDNLDQKENAFQKSLESNEILYEIPIDSAQQFMNTIREII